jgi:imidazolonepropionase-like amidohydrolase
LYIYPGFSLHDELLQLVRESGFSTMDALRAATDTVAGFYGGSESFGAAEPGQAADLLLLDADPVADIRNTKRIRGVVLRGRWLDRAELDAILKRVEQSAQSGCRAGAPGL